MEFNQDVLKQIVDALAASGVFAKASELNALAADVAKKTVQRMQSGYVPAISHSRALRGIVAFGDPGKAIDSKTAASDVEYLKALVTGSTPGSYLVPTLQSSEAIGLLTMGGVVRQAGARVWPMVGVQKENVPIAEGGPTWEYLAQTAQQNPTDGDFGQIPFDLKERRCLTAIPRRLLATSNPAIDTLIEEMIRLTAGEHEDRAIFATSALSGGPTPVYAASGVTERLVGGSANGGDLAFGDLAATVGDAYTAKAKPPFAWFMHPRTLFNRIVGMVDDQGRPIFQLDPSGKVIGTVLGFPVFVSPEIPIDQAEGSGSDQSYAIFTNPRYLNIADSGSLEIAQSNERFFDYNQVAIRGVHAHDFAPGPAAGVVLLKGIN